jgi:hypothetical protein
MGWWALGIVLCLLPLTSALALTRLLRARPDCSLLDAAEALAVVLRAVLRRRDPPPNDHPD